MILIKQVLTICSSIIYGNIFYLLLLTNKKMLFQENIFKKIISNIIFILDMVLIYFIIMRYINNGIITYYSYLLILLGILIPRYIINKMKTYKK